MPAASLSPSRAARLEAMKPSPPPSRRMSRTVGSDEGADEHDLDDEGDVLHLGRLRSGSHGHGPDATRCRSLAAAAMDADGPDAVETAISRAGGPASFLRRHELPTMFADEAAAAGLDATADREPPPTR
jgi:hypothetical protein